MKQYTATNSAFGCYTSGIYNSTPLAVNYYVDWCKL